MAALPSPTQVAGNHSATYEAYYNLVDPNGFGTIGAMEAARFLKKSGLSDVVLSRIWDLSDPGERGCLDKAGMFVALKLVSLAQAGKDINMANINLDIPPPKMGNVPLPKPVKPPLPSNSPLINTSQAIAVDWTVKPAEREKYDKLFDSLQPLNGLIPGNKVKGLLLDSKLPLETLEKIWDLADQDKDGMLNRHEFVAAMHLVYKALEKCTIPNTLPLELMPPSYRKVGPLQTVDGIKADMVALNQSATKTHASNLIWCVSQEEKAKSDILFTKSDIDRDGFVSGKEIKDVFLQSGLPQPVLAHIWALCDIKQSGKLNNEQFALAMWFVARCLSGIEPPAALAPEMVPPSFRSGKISETMAENNNTRYSNPELDMISKDIEELVKEKLALETDIMQKEADIKIKSVEVKNLQSELDTLAATLKQLENQKGEAQKRLNDLKNQKSDLDDELWKVEVELEEKFLKVDKLRIQASEQAEVISVQEKEVMSKKEQLEGLKMEEQRLEEQKNDHTRKLEQLTNNLQDTQLSISQAKALITQLQEQTRQMNDAIGACDSAIEAGDPSYIAENVLRIHPDFRDPQYSKIAAATNGVSSKQNGFEKDPFSQHNGGNARENSSFHSDSFKHDPFSSTADAFDSDANFTYAFSTKQQDTDPFSSFNPSSSRTDPFDTFGEKSMHSGPPNETASDKDPFGCDPFAVLHAPTRDDVVSSSGRTPSPSPALPPKKTKQPPPRPAPPRPTAPPSKIDPFGLPSTDGFSSGGVGGGFADFADFDSKFSNQKTPTTTTSKGTSQSKSLDFTDDPFRDYRYEDPFNIAFDEEPTESKSFDPFGLDGRQSAPLPKQNLSVSTASGRASVPLGVFASEDQQLAWASEESLKLERLRKQRQEQEERDLELAISLSKAAGASK